ncbi:type I-F CRISPR-associated protein Csy1 [Thiorhodococcus fuscus]|uniref:Type I-F CRISPR-associated protein Csy1 n=1 Tax=Thiorhodococcus fuscus TaxID=527200 RepID=A0ABW4Y6N8_9GAMM
MSVLDPHRSSAIRTALQTHVTKRRNEVLAKITGTDAASEKERQKQRDLFELQALLISGAASVSQIQMATHILKGIHPDPKVRVATNLNIDPATLPDLTLVGSHVLRDEIDVDATGNGAFNKKIYELYRLLQTQFDGRSVLDLLESGDVDAVAALSEDASQAQEIANKLTEIDTKRCTQAASHTLAKQVFWPLGNDPHDDRDYHLLAPLYPTSLVHRVYQILQDDRFSEEAKAARQARKTSAWHERTVHEYPHLAVQKLGSSKPQNISQLNSERRGDNYLLASLPPVWRSTTIKPLFNVESLFNVFRWRREVYAQTQNLRRFLEGDPASNQETRQYRDALIDALLDELIQFTAEVRTLDAGWSTDPQCKLLAAHRAWLDPQSNADLGDSIDAIASDFANWLNARLREPLPMGDPEYLYWRKLAREQLKDFSREVE